jgi:hypothetical protein
VVTVSAKNAKMLSADKCAKKAATDAPPAGGRASKRPITSLTAFLGLVPDSTPQNLGLIEIVGCAAHAYAVRDHVLSK